jgi:hypothetical protein
MADAAGRPPTAFVVSVLCPAGEKEKRTSGRACGAFLGRSVCYQSPMPATPSRSQPPALEALRFLIRARQYRDQAIKQNDMEAFEPNWPKHFLMTHAIELAITAYLVFAKGLGEPRTRAAGEKPDRHDLMEHYKEAVRLGLKSSPLVMKELPLLSELHKIHYARYPKIETKPVPAFMSGYDDMVDQLFADVEEALGPLGR